MYEAKMEQMEPDILVDVSSVFQNPLRCAVIRGLPVNKFVFSYYKYFLYISNFYIGLAITTVNNRVLEIKQQRI